MKFLILFFSAAVFCGGLSLTEARSRKMTPEYVQEIQFAMVDCMGETKITIFKLVSINMKDLYSYEDPQILELLSCFYKKIGYSDADGNLQFDEIKQMFKENFKLTKGQRSFLIDKCTKEGGDSDTDKIRLFGKCVQKQSCKLLGRTEQENNCMLGLYDIQSNTFITRKLKDIE